VASPQLTAERFLENPFDQSGKSRLYRTGDWGRFREDGNVDFLGRKDDQVKILGFRVELGEIGVALSRHPAIREATTIAVDGPDGVKRIVVYIVPKAGAVPRVEDVMDFLRSRLPTYMLPAQIIPLERLPVTASGKLDRAALPRMDVGPAPFQREADRPPDELEKRLLDIWEEVLEVRPSGIHDDFFELGGHSLLGAELCVRIEQAIGKPLPIASLFNRTTVAAQADLLRHGLHLARESGLPSVNPDGTRLPFFFVHGIGGQVIGYRDLAKRLGPDQPVYGLQADDGEFEGRVPSIEVMAGEYIRKMKIAEPSGPYLLGGHSFGGFVAFEMARQLSRQGDRAALVALIDTRASALPAYATLLPPGKRVRYMLGSLYATFRFHAGAIRGLSWKGRVSYTATRLGKRLRWSRSADHFGPLLDRVVPRVIQEAVEANLKALARYRPRPYPGKVALFRAQDTHPVVYDKQHLGWGDLALGGVELYEVPGNHETIVLPPNLDVLVDKLTLAIRAATGGTSDVES
jgi:thioesterase domain-containing protein